MLPSISNCKVCVIGLGYVGLPLAAELAKKNKCLINKQQLARKVVGFDIDKERIVSLKQGIDITGQISQNQLENLSNLSFTSEDENLVDCEVFIITVPTPIDKNKKPDLKPLKLASSLIGEAINKRHKKSGAFTPKTTPVIIFESTVYPGATEEYCVPIIEKHSSLKFNNTNPNEGFMVGYSPERINPGDKKHTLVSIKKVTSGCNDQTRKWVKDFYGSIIKAGTFSASSIKVAEAAKVIENTQRDLNIALINELSIIFERIGINTTEVLQAANTKWNFLDFKPGLVGGHCIGVDPYYLTHKSIQLGYIPEIVLAGRKINDCMSDWIVSLLIKKMASKNIAIGNSEVLVMGYTFKEDCNDTRNTQVKKLIECLKEFNINIFLNDPFINSIGVDFVKLINPFKEMKQFDSIIICVAHEEYKSRSLSDWENLCKENYLIMDIKNILPNSPNIIKI